MAATGARLRVPVAVACRVLGLSPQGYYKWLKDPIRRRDWDDTISVPFTIAHLYHAIVDGGLVAGAPMEYGPLLAVQERVVALARSRPSGA